MNDDEMRDMDAFLSFEADGYDLTALDLEMALNSARRMTNETGARVMLGMALLRSVSQRLDGHYEDLENLYGMRLALAGLEYDFLEASGMKCKLTRGEWIEMMVNEELERAELKLVKEIIKSELKKQKGTDILDSEILDGGEQ